MTVSIPKKEVKEFLKLKIVSQIYPIKERISFFENKYKKKLDEFEKVIKESKKESFEAWDDYIEWKAYIKTLNELEKNLKEIEEAEDFKLT